MEGVVPIAERKKRNKMLRILSEKKKCILPNAIRKTLPVLWGTRRKDGKMFCFPKIMYAFKNHLMRVLSTK